LWYYTIIESYGRHIVPGSPPESNGPIMRLIAIAAIYIQKIINFYDKLFNSITIIYYSVWRSFLFSRVVGIVLTHTHTHTHKSTHGSNGPTVSRYVSLLGQRETSLFYNCRIFSNNTSRKPADLIVSYRP